MQNNYLQDTKFEGKGALIPFLKRIFSYSFRYKTTSIGFIVSVVLVGLSDAIWPVIWMYFLDQVVVPLVDQYQQLKSQGVDYALDYSGLWCCLCGGAAKYRKMCCLICATRCLESYRNCRIRFTINRQWAGCFRA